MRIWNNSALARIISVGVSSSQIMARYLVALKGLIHSVEIYREGKITTNMRNFLCVEKSKSEADVWQNIQKNVSQPI